jgi:hypothetical protein
MLDPWIIDEILRREDEKRREHERPRVDVPLERPHGRDSEPKVPTQPPPESERGVVVIDI